MALLKRVSRSFYLSVRMLPIPMRRGVCIGYLLARASDTLADSQKDSRLLDAFESGLRARHAGGMPPMTFTPSHPGEARLMRELPSVFNALHTLPDQESSLVRDVVTTIIGGQRMDMTRFERASANHVVSLDTADDLDDYTWRVAGCVGQFWTRLGFLTLTDAFSNQAPEKLESLGIRFGQGLQLVNILRDIREDLENGRNYLPSDPCEWMEKARRNLRCGLEYANAMRLHRLHIAASLPARIGIDTLDAITRAGTDAPGKRIKIPRSRVWFHFAAACKSSLSRTHP